MFQKDLVRNLLANPGGLKWSLQGFGMLRLYLSHEVRLHVWDSEHRTANVSDIHTHPWNFTSQVVAGRIYNTRYEETPEQYGTPHHKAVIECGADAKLCGEPTTVRLHTHTSEKIEAGESYHQDATEIHNTTFLPGTVSIIRREFSKDTEHASVYWPDGQSWVDAKPRAATPEEVTRICNGALERWFRC